MLDADGALYLGIMSSISSSSQAGSATPSGSNLVQISHLSSNAVSQSVDLGQNNNPNTTPTKDYKVRVVVYLRGVQRGYAEEGERGSTPTG